MADLNLTFSELYTEIEKYLGTYNSGSAAAGDVVDAKFIVNRAYSRYVSYFDWSFLYQYRTLETVDGTYVYELPTDFSYLTFPKMYFDGNDGYSPVTQRSTGQIIDARSESVYESFPIFFALQAGSYHKETGQGWEMMFYPTPNAKYHLKYFCKINPEKLVSDGDIPIGGADMSDCLLELSLAYAEAYKDERKAVHAETVKEILSPAKMMDNRRRTKSLGSLNTVSGMFIDFEDTHNGDVIISS